MTMVCLPLITWKLYFGKKSVPAATMSPVVVVKLSAAWGGLRKHKPLVDATLDWLNCASPKLIPPEDRLPIGGGMI